MTATLRTSTGAKILVWRERDAFHVQLADTAGPARRCRELDLFEALAELAGLDLDVGAQSAEAMRLADRAKRKLRNEARIDGESTAGSPA